MRDQTRIVLIDADVEQRGAFARQLRDASYHVCEADTGESGLLCVQDSAPDLVLISEALSDVDTLELCQGIRGMMQDKPYLGSYVMLFSPVAACAQPLSDADCQADSIMLETISGQDRLAYVQALLQVRNTQKDLHKTHAVLLDALPDLPENVNETVLVADDDPRILRTFARMLALYGYQVLTAEDGATAIECYRRERPEIVLTDVRMPDLDGFDVLKAIHAIDGSAEVIFVTGHGDMQMAIEALRAGASDFIPKPVNRTNLEAALRRARERLYMKRSLRRARQALQASEQHYRELFEGVPIGLFRTTNAGKVLDANPTLVKMLGYSNLAALLSSCSPDWYVDPEDRSRALEHSREAGGTHGFEARWRRLDGEVIWVRIIGQEVRSPNGQVCYEGSAEDITERKAAEQKHERLLLQIQEQAAQLQQVINTVSEGLVLLDGAQRIVLTNARADIDLDVLAAGAREGAVLATLGEQPLHRWLAPPPAGLWHELVWKRNIYEIIAHTLKQAPDAAHPYGNGWVLVLRNVTRQRRIEQRVQEHERLAAVGQLAAGIAHDFNNVMSIVSMYAQIASRSETLTDQERERLAIINQQSLRATKLIRQILDFSRHAVLERKPLDFLALLREQAQLFRRTLPETITIELEYESGDYAIDGDVTRMQQVLMNLAFNARDAMPEGGVLSFQLGHIMLIEKSIPPLPGMSPGLWLRLTVSDTGTGIATDVISHIFEPFYTTKELGKGSGLGLAQVHGIVGAHEGFIDVESEPGQGATFRIYLPALTSEEESLEDLTTMALEFGHGETILLVEDESVTRHALREGLELLEYQVLEAANGQDALAIYEQHATEIALVLTDVVMPQLGGMALVEALRARAASIPIILLTGHPLGHTDDVNLHRVGAAWLQKPVNLDELSRLLAQLLATNRHPGC